MKDKTPQESSKILFAVSLCFALPFLLLAPFAGSLADRFRKRSIILFTRGIEIFCTCFGTIFFYIQSEWGGYFILVLMASHTAIFGPAKLGILPEILPPDQLSRANGIMSAAMYSASILGACLASVFCSITGGVGAEKYVFINSFCIIFSLVGAIIAFYISRSRVYNTHQKIQIFNFKEIWIALRDTRYTRFLTSSILLGAFFLLVGAYVQLEIVPFVQFWGFPEHYGGFLFPIVAVGVGVGSYLAGRVSGKNIELAYTPISAIGIGFFLMGMYFSTTLPSLVIFLLLLGVFGGFYQVPLNAYVQYVSPDYKRGRVLAANNFLDFFGVMLTSFVIWFLGGVLRLDPGKSFLFVGVIVSLVGIIYIFLWRESIYRFFCDIIYKRFFIRHFRLQAIPRSCFLCQVSNENDVSKIVALLPRVVRVMPLVFREKFSLKLFSYCIPIVRVGESNASYEETLGYVVRFIRETVEKGESICILFIGDEGCERTIKMLHSLLRENDLLFQKLTLEANSYGKLFLDLDII